MAVKKKAEEKRETQYVQCQYCGESYSVANGNFYLVNEKSIFKAHKDEKGKNILPFCKKCIKDKVYIPYLHDTKDYQRAVYLTCRKFDIMYTPELADMALQRANGNTTMAIGYVFGLLGSLQQYSTAHHNFDDSENIALNEQEDFYGQIEKIKNGSKLDAQDKRNLKDIKRILTYDPFEGAGMSEMQLKNAYSDLISYLSFSEDIATSPLQLSTVLELIHISSQIRDLDMYISVANNSLENSKDNQGQINTWMNQKSKLLASKSAIIKENKSWLSESSSNKNKLGVLMKKYRDMGFEEAEINYFDALTSEATKTVMDLSHKSIMETFDFGSEEIKEIVGIQRERIRELEMEIASMDKDKRDAVRELVEFKKQNNIE